MAHQTVCGGSPGLQGVGIHLEEGRVEQELHALPPPGAASVGVLGEAGQERGARPQQREVGPGVDKSQVSIMM